MKRDEKNSMVQQKKSGFSEKEFIEYLEERFRQLRLDEQKFREEVLSGSTYFSSGEHTLKLTGKPLTNGRTV